MPLEIPDRSYRFVALDVETANQSPWSISQIGVATVDMDNQVQVYATLLDPRCGFAPFNVRLTGIHPDHVVGAPRFAEVLAALDPVLARHTVFQHSNFDARAMAAAAARDGLDSPTWELMDSYRVARRAWPEFTGKGGHGLAHLKDRLGLDFTHHDAGEDAKAAAQVVLHAEAKMGLDFRMIHATGKARSRRKVFIPAPNPQGPLVGNVVVFTGQLSIPRAEAIARAAKAGIKVSDRLSRLSTHLVVGGPTLPMAELRSPSTKERQARDMQAAGHGLVVLTEAAFLAMLDNGGTG